MRTLKQLYQEHQGKVSDKWSSYIAGYDTQFTPYRHQTIQILEIGIQNGGSLEIWSKYFSEAKKIVGCDINPDCALLHYDDPRIAVVVGDANTDGCEQQILTHSANFDLIIDDGSHKSSDIIRSFARYFSHLNRGGLYVAEDLHCSYWQEYEGGLSYPYSSMSFFQRLTDIVNHGNWGNTQTRVELLTSFANFYGTVFDEQLLSDIHSIEFTNSLCLIRKAAPEANALGARFIAGEDAIVANGVKELHRSSLQCPAQHNNKWSAYPAGSQEAQLLLTDPKDPGTTSTEPEADSFKIQLFIDSGSGFSEAESISYHLELPPCGELHTTFDLTDRENIQALRVNPLNDYAVLSINEIYLSTATEKVDLIPYITTNHAATIDNLLCFAGNDSIISFENLEPTLLSKATRLDVSFEFVITGRVAKAALLLQSNAKNYDDKEFLPSALWSLQLALYGQKKLGVEQKKTLQTLREDYEAALKIISETYSLQKVADEQRLQSLTQEHVSTLNELKGHEITLREEQEKLIHAFREDHASAISALAEQYATRQAAYEQRLQSVNEKHTSTQNEAKERETSLRQEQERLISALREDHASAISTLGEQNALQQAAYEQRLQSLTGEYTSTQNEAKERETFLREEQERLISALRQDHASAISALAEQNALQKAAYEQRLQSLTEKHALTLQEARDRETSLKDERGEIINEVREDHVKAINLMRQLVDKTLQSHSDQLTAVRTDHMTQVASMEVKMNDLETSLGKIRGWRGYRIMAWINRSKLK